MEGGGAIEPSGLSSCPSFNSYSSDFLAEVEHGCDRHHRQVEEEDGDYDDFEFVPVVGDVSDDGFVTGPVFPVFNRDLLLENGYGIDGCDLRSRGGGGGGYGGGGGGGGDVRSIRIPLMDLFMEEDLDQPYYSTSSEADELEGIPEGSYSVWTPRESALPLPSLCKKSKSTGSRSSRRWRFLNLLRRCNSDGKDSFVFLTPSSIGEAKLTKEMRNSISKSTTGAAAAEERKGRSAASTSASAPEVFYTSSKVAVKGGGNQRKSYLPNRQYQVGFFANVNSLGRTFPPFGRI